MEGDQEANMVKMQTVQLLPEKQLEAWHQQMIGKEASYQQKLQSSQEAQQRQAVLIQKLQAKVYLVPFLTVSKQVNKASWQN